MIYLYYGCIHNLYYMDFYQQRYIYEPSFTYRKFVNLDQPYSEHNNELGPINLIIQTYPIQRPEKLEELLLCLHNNLNNKCIKKIYNLYEGNIDFLPEYIKHHDKLINLKVHKDEKEYTYTHVPDFSKLNNGLQYIKTGYENGGVDETTDKPMFLNNLKDRLTWKYFITFCLKTFQDGEIVCIANSDIILEDSFEWYSVSNMLNDKLALCLSRHEIDKKGDVFVDFWAMKCWSQDCWVFRKTDKMKTLQSRIDFSIGNCMGCDNVIAGLALANKYIPINYAFKYRIFHLDRVTKIRKENVTLTKSHDNRIVENMSNLPMAKPCPFINYGGLLAQPIHTVYNTMVAHVDNNAVCERSHYHVHN